MSVRFDLERLICSFTKQSKEKHWSNYVDQWLREKKKTEEECAISVFKLSVELFQRIYLPELFSFGYDSKIFG